MTFDPKPETLRQWMAATPADNGLRVLPDADLRGYLTQWESDRRRLEAALNGLRDARDALATIRDLLSNTQEPSP